MANEPKVEISVNLDKALRILALWSVEERDVMYRLRVVMRWFSRQFHTPLTDVEKLPIPYLLQHYYENYYASLEDEELEKARVELTETDVEKAERLRAEEEERASAEAFAKQTEAELKMKDIDLKKQSDDKATSIAKQVRIVPETRIAESPLLPDISYNFVNPSEFEKIISDTDLTNIVKGTKKP